MNWLFVGLHVIMCSWTNLYAITVLTPTKPWFIKAPGNPLLERSVAFGHWTDSTEYKQEFEGYILWNLHLLDRSDVRPHGVIYRERWRCCRTFVRSQ